MRFGVTAISKGRIRAFALDCFDSVVHAGGQDFAVRQIHKDLHLKSLFAESGKSIIVRHWAMKPVTVGMIPGVEFYRIWGSDTTIELPSDGRPPAQLQYFPPKNGFQFGMFSLPPGHQHDCSGE